jgi:hypothetical protein
VANNQAEGSTGGGVKAFAADRIASPLLAKNASGESSHGREEQSFLSVMNAMVDEWPLKSHSCKERKGGAARR